MRDLPRRSVLGLLGAAGLAGVPGVAAAQPSPSAPPPGAEAGAAPSVGATALAPPPGGWRRVAEDVRNETRWAWRSYVERAFGHDQIKPVSGGHEEFFVPGHPMGLTVVEALDTLWLMELDAEFAEGVRWVKANLSFDVDAPFQVFETNIRMLGGLLSAYHVSGDSALLNLARDLADRLLVAFTKSPTGIPYRYVNLRTGAVSSPETNLAETGTYITEFGSLSKWTGDRKYYNAAKKAFKVTFDKRTAYDLLPWDVHAETGAWRNRYATIGPPADSYYEYLWDGWHLFGDRDLKRWWDILLRGILRNQTDIVGGRLWFAQVDAFTGRRDSRTQSELAAFFGGLLAESGDIARGRAYHDSWTAVQDRYGVLPEGINYTSLRPTSVGNQLRPEYADGAFFLWLATRDEVYRERAYRHYLEMKRTSKTNYGYTILTDVTTGAKGDFCPGYWWSEQLKYYWLIFGDARRFDYTSHYLSTEGNIFLGARR
ncbi:mannosyl-oligosaccharide alpha-1,2-mannosidase [Lentzea atacamensis]|uniref:Mannosyl-oligosaccharide alpha-1,2-mannosidase n=1 Tax=Lentzea atacamensis TaxID=531938 RepID=A0A316I7B9_9PSEU|nr:glycoside hydrolase family 47 protein [Lentzea atacamensis]PWK89377.1 mannosyl-oligosaccharide alpha-1,2-mannosidase [Lentzea atacamensis]